MSIKALIVLLSRAIKIFEVAGNLRVYARQRQRELPASDTPLCIKQSS